MGNTALNIVAVKPLIKVDGCGKGLNLFIRMTAESATPGFFPLAHIDSILADFVMRLCPLGLYN